MESLLVEIVKPLIETLAGQNGQFAQILIAIASLMGLVRIVLKPIMAALQKIAASTKTKRDDELLGRVEKSKTYKTITFILDYVLSIKLPPKI